MFARLMQFYGLSDAQVMQMPARRFWLLSGMINRIEAQRDLRQFQVAAAAQAESEGRRDFERHLLAQIGQVAEIEPRLDRAGLEQLRALAG